MLKYFYWQYYGALLIQGSTPHIEKLVVCDLMCAKHVTVMC